MRKKILKTAEIDDSESEMIKFYSKFTNRWEPRLDFMERNLQNTAYHNEVEAERRA